MEGQVISLPRKDWSDGCSETNYDCMQNGGFTFIFINKETFFSRYAPPPHSSSFIDLSAVAAFDESKNALCCLKFKRSVCREGGRVGKVVKPNEKLVLTSSQIGRQSRCSDAAQVSWELSWSLLPQPLAKFKRVTSLICSCSLPSRPRLRSIPPDSMRASWRLPFIWGWIITFRFQPKSKMEASILILSSSTLVIVTWQC